VTQDGLSVLGWHTEIFKQRSDRVPDVMDFDEPDIVGFADTAKRPAKVPRGRSGWPQRTLPATWAGALGSAASRHVTPNDATSRMPGGYYPNFFHCPSETTSTEPPATLMAVCSSMA
jgi:hypothetical protein